MNVGFIGGFCDLETMCPCAYRSYTQWPILSNTMDVGFICGFCDPKTCVHVPTHLTWWCDFLTIQWMWVSVVVLVIWKLCPCAYKSHTMTNPLAIQWMWVSLVVVTSRPCVHVPTHLTRWPSLPIQWTRVQWWFLWPKDCVHVPRDLTQWLIPRQYNI